jgi:pimeloyl-[acyl-carrier protein] methyl ester esterase
MATLDRDDGVRLHVEATGAGPALLMLHGWSRSGADLAWLAQRLAGRHRVIRPDLRGHGRSSPGTFTLGTLTQDLEAVATAQAPAGVLLLGWSLGALVALAALATSPALRARVGGLVLVGATPRFMEGPGWPHGQPARGVEGLALRLRRQPVRALARFLDDCLAPGEPERISPARLAALRAAPAPDPSCAQAGLDLLAAADLCAALPTIQTRTLVIHGDADAVCPLGAGRALAAGMPRARLLTLPGAGHAPFLSQEDRVVEAVSAFAGAGA